VFYVVETAGLWPWKLEPAKECVTTHLPNHITPKTNGVEDTVIIDRYHTLFGTLFIQQYLQSIETRSLLSL